MKTKIYSILFFALIIQCVAIFTGCYKKVGDATPCNPVKDIYCYLYPDDRAKIPYHFNDTIKLQYSWGVNTTYNFVQQSIDSGFNYFSLPDGDCPGDNQHWQYIKYNYKCSSYPNPLIITQYLTGCGGSNTSVIFDQQEFMIFTGSIRSPYYSNQMYINGKTYINIVKLVQASIYGDTNYYAFYNQDYGALLINSNGKIWQRLPQ